MYRENAVICKVIQIKYKKTEISIYILFERTTPLRSLILTVYTYLCTRILRPV